MSKPQRARTGRRREGDAEWEWRQHRQACQQCRNARRWCILGQGLLCKLGIRVPSIDDWKGQWA